MLHLQLPDGKVIPVQNAFHRAFGRQDYRYSDAQAVKNVSRQQFVIAAEGELCRVKSLSAVNPTKVYRPGPPLSAILLEQGEAAVLHPGDWVLLNAADKSQRITLCKEPPPSQQQQPEAQAGRSPPAQPSPQTAQQGQQPEQAGQRKRAPPEDEPLATRKKRLAAKSRTASPAAALAANGADVVMVGSGDGAIDGAQEAVPAEAPPVPKAGATAGAAPAVETAVKPGAEASQLATPAAKPLLDAARTEEGAGASDRGQPALAAASENGSAAAAASTPQGKAGSAGQALQDRPAPAVAVAPPQQQPSQPPPSQQQQAQQPQPQQAQAQQAQRKGQQQDEEAAPSSAPQQGQCPAPGERQNAEVAPSAPLGPPPKVVLILVGIQGSGKSTFSHRLLATSAQQWQRINQDSINGGKRGTKEMCLAAARSALAAGQNPIIDRTNIDREQRRPFVELARELGAEAHCVVLRLPIKVCMARAAGRENHEGGLQGKGVYAAINIMNSNYARAGAPTEAEGFGSIMYCERDAEVDAALRAWSGFGSEHRDPLAMYRQLAPPKKEPLPPEAAAGSSKAGGKGKGKGKGAAPVTGRASIAHYLQKPAAAAAAEAGAGTAGAAGAAAAGAGPNAAGAAGKPGAQQGGSQRAQHGQAAGGSQGGSELPGPSQRAQQAQQGGSPRSPLQQAQRGTSPGKADALKLLMSSAKQQPQHGASSQHGSGGAGTAGAAAAAGDQRERGSRHQFKGGDGEWAMALVKIAANPERARHDPAFFADDRVVRITDKFAKARHHTLVLARAPRLQGPLDLTPSDLPLLKHMLEVGRQWAAQQLGPDGQPDRFSFGFHSAPSLRQLHLHVISQDLVSDGVKKKEHYLKFLPPFFLPVRNVMQEIEARGRLDYSPAEKEAAVKAGALRCHRCGAVAKHLPALKTHLAACRAPAGVFE